MRSMVSVLQNHHLVEVGRDHCKPSGPTPLLKQGHLESLAQARVQTDFENLQGEGLHNLSLGNLCAVTLLR